MSVNPQENLEFMEDVSENVIKSGIYEQIVRKGTLSAAVFLFLFCS